MEGDTKYSNSYDVMHCLFQTTWRWLRISSPTFLLCGHCWMRMPVCGVCLHGTTTGSQTTWICKGTVSGNCLRRGPAAPLHVSCVCPRPALPLRLLPGAGLDDDKAAVGGAQAQVAGEVLGRLDEGAGATQWQVREPYPSAASDQLVLLHRACIRPEISRTVTFGDKGVSAGQYYKQHLQYIRLNSEPVDFTKKNLSFLREVGTHYLMSPCVHVPCPMSPCPMSPCLMSHVPCLHVSMSLQDAYESHFLKRVLALPAVTVTDVLNQHRQELKEVQVPYSSHKDFEAQAKKLKIMFDFRVRVASSAWGLVCHQYPTPLSLSLPLPLPLRVACHAQRIEVWLVSCTKVEGFT